MGDAAYRDALTVAVVEGQATLEVADVLMEYSGQELASLSGDWQFLVGACGANLSDSEKTSCVVRPGLCGPVLEWQPPTVDQCIRSLDLLSSTGLTAAAERWKQRHRHIRTCDCTPLGRVPTSDRRLCYEASGPEATVCVCPGMPEEWQNDVRLQIFNCYRIARAELGTKTFSKLLYGGSWCCPLGGERKFQESTKTVSQAHRLLFIMKVLLTWHYTWRRQNGRRLSHY